MTTIHEKIAKTIPAEFVHKDFEVLELLHQQGKLPAGKWYPIQEYMRKSNLKTRRSVYQRIKSGELEIIKMGKYTFVKEMNV